MTAATPEWHPHLRMALASRRSLTPTHKTLLHPNFAVKLLSNHAFPPLPPSPSFRPQFPSAPSPCSPPCGSHHHPEPRRAGRYRRQAPDKTKHKGLGEGRKEGRKGGRGQPRARGGGRAEAATGRRCCAALRGRGHEGPGPGPAEGPRRHFAAEGLGGDPGRARPSPGSPPCARWGGQTARCLGCPCGRRGGKPCGSATSAPELEKRLEVLSSAASGAGVLPSQRIEVFLPEWNGQAGFIYLCISPHTPRRCRGGCSCRAGRQIPSHGKAGQKAEAAWGWLWCSTEV